MEDLGTVEGGTHRLNVRVYYEDTDASGIVYHANYLKFIERGRTDFLRLAGFDHTDLAATDHPVYFTVRGMTLTFHKPARLDDRLSVLTHFTGLTGARLLARQTVMKDDELLFEAEVEIACISPEGKPRRLPASVRDGLTPYLVRTR